MNADTIVIASTYPPRLFDLYKTREAALERLADVNRSNPDHRYEVMTLGQYDAAERTYYLSQPLTEITPERFDDMLNILPPVAWQHRDGVERFIISEAEQGYFHMQFAKRGERCFCRPVHVREQATWITGKEIDDFLAGQKRSHVARIEEERAAGLPERGRV